MRMSVQGSGCKEFLDRHWTEIKLLAIDIEGNGRSPQDVVELAVVTIESGRVIPGQPTAWLVRPSAPISHRAERIHGISNADVEKSPTFDKIRASVEEVLDQYPVVGHAVAVDYRILRQKMPHWRPSAALDTLKLARTVLPRQDKYSLSDLIIECGIDDFRSSAKLHRAGYDATAAAHLFVSLARLADASGDLTFRALSHVCGVSIDPSPIPSQGALF